MLLLGGQLISGALRINAILLGCFVVLPVVALPLAGVIPAIARR
jgi:hypothetical protein